MKLDILCFGAHPDDVELTCSGTILSHKEMGKKVGIVDLTLGQLGTRGTPELRLLEAEKAAQILGLDVRENLGMQDGWFTQDQESTIRIIEMIRKYRPDVVITNSLHDRHPDHGKGCKLVTDACFYSGLVKIDTNQEKWRPRAVYHYIQDRYRHPDIIVDISGHLEKKFEAIMAFSSQFYDPESKEPDTPISSRDFLEVIEGRAIEYGRIIGVRHGEGFNVARVPGVMDITSLV